MSEPLDAYKRRARGLNMREPLLFGYFDCQKEASRHVLSELSETNKTGADGDQLSFLHRLSLRNHRATISTTHIR